MFPRAGALFFATLLLSFGCETDTDPGPSSNESGLEDAPIEPPFEVVGDLEGLLLVWFDDEGPHTAATRDDIPEAHREYVRVSDLGTSPEASLDPELVYVADVREAMEGGAYAVRVARREAYDALVDEAQGVAPMGTLEVAAADPVPTGVEPSAGPSEDVIIYGADWCGACQETARFLTARNVAFTERNVERDPGAREEMNEKARAAGVRPTGIPVIDFRGTILTGFDPSRLGRLIAQGA